MLKIKYPKYAFAIRFSREENTIQHSLFFNFLQEITELYPAFKVEGINVEKRVSNIETKTPLVKIKGDGTYSEYGKLDTKTRDVIAVGVSKQYAVSFESLEDFTLSKACNLYSVPVLTLTEHYNLIVAKIKAFVKAHFIKKQEPICASVRYHSNFARVSTNAPEIRNSRLEYSDLDAILNAFEPEETAYNLKSVTII